MRREGVLATILVSLCLLLLSSITRRLSILSEDGHADVGGAVEYSFVPVPPLSVVVVTGAVEVEADVLQTVPPVVFVTNLHVCTQCYHYSVCTIDRPAFGYLLQYWVDFEVKWPD